MRTQQQSFNSTMVRLKVWFDTANNQQKVQFQFHNGAIKSKEHINRNGWDELFQFHNGAIKSGYDIPIVGGQAMFQFHNGSIKRRYAVICDDQYVVGFNSTMGRLKVGVNGVWLYERAVSIPRRLKARMRPHRKDHALRFNSTMGRLKDYHRRW